MKNEEILAELESLVEGIEQSLMMLTGTICETTEPVAVLKNLFAAKHGAETDLGPNAWRDRLVRKMEIVAAMKARHSPKCDASLRAQISTLLTPQTERSSTH